jgi:serine phosphatase RsbU (regulator of sigma subunit)
VTLRTRVLVGLVVLFAACLGLAASGWPYVAAPAAITALLLVLGLLVAGLFRLLRWLLWKVGRRLAFSYFLIGIVPIPLVVLLLLVAAFLLSGFFLGHLAREAVADERRALAAAADRELARFMATGRPGPAGGDGLAYAYYRGGQRVGGDGAAPATWPVWLGDPAIPPAFVVTSPGEPATLAAAAIAPDSRAVLAVLRDDLSARLRQHAGFWIETHYGGEGGAAETDPEEGRIQLVIGSFRTPLRTFAFERRSEDAEAFFAASARGDGLQERPLLWWGELAAPVRRLADGELVAEEALLSLNAPPRRVRDALFSSSSEIDSAAWGSLLVLAALLFDLYLVAVVMAVFLIFGLSRAVNRLSRATHDIARGDFSVRIPVRRQDQIGALQSRFNEMTAHLETLVASAAQKELLEKELAIAAELQQSLLPKDLAPLEGVELATLFEPCAAIGGDYFDILPLSAERLAVAVADVSGHGLHTGLRMAMLKAALTVLLERSEDPEEVLHRLDVLVRSEGDRRFFVTAALAILDLPSGRLTLVNAGHPPAYVLRGSQVEEVLLPSAPLGTLGCTFRRRTLQLSPGDRVVWMSDGIVEATDEGGEPLGYERVQAALAGPVASAGETRDRLLEAMRRHTGDRPPGDDRTLVALTYKGWRMPKVA